MTLFKLSTSLITIVLVSILYFTYTVSARYVKHQRFMKANGCMKSYKGYPFKDPFYGFDLLYRVIMAARGKKLLEFMDRLLEDSGNTYINSTLLGPTVIFTADPENAKAVWATKFADWSVGPSRFALKFAFGNSILMTDGPTWSHVRSSMRPIFARDNVANLDLFEEHVQSFLRRIPSDGSTIDLEPLFHSLSLDIGTEFVFGQSMSTLSTDRSTSQAQLHEDFELIMEDVVHRARFGKLYPFLKNKHAAAALEHVKSAAEVYSREAIGRQESRKNEDETGNLIGSKTGYSFLDDLAKEMKDPEKLRDEALTMIFAGRDTTGSALGFLWYQLARNPAVWEQLVAEVDELEGALPTYEWLKHAKYLRFCQHEAMRLFPSVPLYPPRSANRDTVLPVGGGPDGTAPLFVPKGAVFAFNQWALNHRKDIWGEDANDFKPSRWESLKPGWNYIPFGGGPRVCLGQEFALTEVYYVTVRLIQMFRRIETRDPDPWVEKISTKLSSQKGVLVGLYA